MTHPRTAEFAEVGARKVCRHMQATKWPCGRCLASARKALEYSGVLDALTETEAEIERLRGIVHDTMASCDKHQEGSIYDIARLHGENAQLRNLLDQAHPPHPPAPNGCAACAALDRKEQS